MKKVKQTVKQKRKFNGEQSGFRTPDTLIKR